MKNVEFSAIEKEMANFNFAELTTSTTASKANIVAAKNVADIKTEICNVWSRIRKYVVLAESIPIVGKFITILAELLDAICGAA